MDPSASLLPLECGSGQNPELKQILEPIALRGRSKGNRELLSFATSVDKKKPRTNGAL
jgi:hypothetical protein